MRCSRGQPSAFAHHHARFRSSLSAPLLTCVILDWLNANAHGTHADATFGTKVDSNILNSYPSNALVSVARIGLAAVVLFSYPVMTLCARVCLIGIYDYFAACCCKKVDNDVGSHRVSEVEEPIIRASKALDLVRAAWHHMARRGCRAHTLDPTLMAGARPRPHDKRVWPHLSHDRHDHARGAVGD